MLVLLLLAVIAASYFMIWRPLETSYRARMEEVDELLRRNIENLNWLRKANGLPPLDEEREFWRAKAKIWARMP